MLVVEDDPVAQRALRNAFLALNADTYAAMDLASATRAIAERRWTAAVVDLSLPDGSGIDFVRFLRERWTDLPIVILSQAGDFEAKIAALRAGADAYYEKPMEWRSLANSVLHLAQGTAGSRILIVEDDPVTASAMQRVLERVGYCTAVCNDARRFETSLIAFHPDAIIMDMHLPFAGGAELAAFLRQDGRFEAIPVIYVTALHPDAEPVRSAVLRGESVLQKPVRPDLLLVTMSSRIEHSRRLRAHLERDSLTGLLTRGVFLSRAASTAATVDRHRAHRFALAMIDVDHFKEINDRYGHPAGDQVLVALADALRRGLRETDYIGRYGGEEFVVMMAEADEEDGVRLLARILDSFQSTRHALGPAAAVSVTFSAGVAALGEGCGIEDAVMRADRALYQAKATGRNRICGASQPRAGGDSDPIDSATLDSLRDLSVLSGHDVVSELVELFIGLVPRRLAAIADAVAGRQADRLVRESHALRGAAGNVGVFQVMRACEVLEVIGSEQRWADAGSAVTELERTLDPACAALIRVSRTGGA